MCTAIAIIPVAHSREFFIDIDFSERGVVSHKEVDRLKIPKPRLLPSVCSRKEMLPVRPGTKCILFGPTVSGWPEKKNGFRRENVPGFRYFRFLLFINAPYLSHFIAYYAAAYQLTALITTTNTLITLITEKVAVKIFIVVLGIS